MFVPRMENHKVVNSDGMEIPVIGKTQLLINKKATGRQKDLYDVLWMESE